MRDIVVVGSLNVDLSLRAEHLPGPGETVRGHDFTLGPGGKGLNQATGASRLGGRVHMIGRVGSDRFAEVPQRSLREAGVDTSHLKRSPQSSTGTAVILVDADSGQNAIAVAGGANQGVTPADVHDAIGIFRASAVLLVQLELPLDTVEAALDLARANHVTTILDPSPLPSRPETLSDSLLRKVDILTPNETEASRLSEIGVHDPESAARAGARLQQRTHADVLVTLGAAGCVWTRSTGFQHLPAPRVEAIDTTAAGDAFNGALAVSLARGESLDLAIQFALHAGSAATLRRGAADSLPRLEEIPTWPAS